MIKLLLKLKICDLPPFHYLLLFISLSRCVSSPGGFPYRSGCSVGSGGNGEGVSEFYEETDPKVGDAVGYGRPETRPEAAQTMEGAEEGEREGVYFSVMLNLHSVNSVKWPTFTGYEIWMDNFQDGNWI